MSVALATTRTIWLRMEGEIRFYLPINDYFEINSPGRRKSEQLMSKKKATTKN